MRFFLAALGVALLSTLAGCGGQAHDIAWARHVCGGTTGSVLTFADEGHSIIIEGAKDDKYVYAECVFGALRTSQALVSEVGTTTALMGRQSEDDGDYHYEWSYHPDNGLDMTITEN